jgi:hypothetical protein
VEPSADFCSVFTEVRGRGILGSQHPQPSPGLTPMAASASSAPSSTKIPVGGCAPSVGSLAHGTGALRYFSQSRGRFGALA